MNKHIQRIVFLASVLTMIMLMSIFASAANANITVAAAENGEVKVSEESGKAVIVTTPDVGYITASVKLGSKTLSPSEANVYKCDIPSKETELKVTFRRARLSLSKDELAMKSGKTFKIYSNISYIDGNVETRIPVKNNDVVYESSNPDVVSVDKDGVLTAHKMGYARITASAVAGNGVESFFYVIVDGDKSPVVGTIQLNAYFLEEEILNYGLSDMHPGHSFLIFTNTSGHDITINSENMFTTRVFTQKYYDAVNSYDGNGYDPLTYYYATNGEPESSENSKARAAYAESGFFDIYKRGECSTYTVKNNEIVTIGNTGNDGISEMLSGDISETIERLGLSSVFEDISSIKDIDFFFTKLVRLIGELGYDFTLGYNPINGHSMNGGVTINAELYNQLSSRNYTVAAACKTDITQVQLDAMIDFAQYDNHFNVLERNCTLFASDAWNLITAAKPQYHMEPDIGGVTNALAMPLFLRNRILSMAPLFALDKDIEFYNGISVIKPKKSACANETHEFVLKNAKITKAGKLVCPECGAEKAGTTLTEMNIKLGKVYCEGVIGVWRSSNTKVAIVTPAGMIIPRAKGVSTISYRLGGKTYSCKVTVE